MVNMDKKEERLIAELREKPVKRVLFVCLGNICRSPAGEGVLKEIVKEKGDEDKWVIDSAGTGGWHVGELPDRRMRIHARNRGIELTHHCRQVRPQDFDDFDIIIPMDGNNEVNLRRMAPTLEAARKIVPMATFISPSFYYDYVPDPYYEGAEGFELVLNMLQDGCQRIYEDLSFASET